MGTCCTNYTGLGCFDICMVDLTLPLNAPEDGTYSLVYNFANYTHTIEAEGVEGEPLTFINEFGTGVINAIIYTPSGDLLNDTCYTFTVERPTYSIKYDY